MSYSIGAFASLIFGFGFLWLILSSGTGYGSIARYDSGSRTSIPLAGLEPGQQNNVIRLSAGDYARARSDIAAESPSVNPNGSLIELTKLLVNGEMRADEVVVVADVFEDGSAHIAQVVEPSRNGNAVYELAKALDFETSNSPFVPATLDQRSDTIRVILKIQSVDVSTREKPRKRKLSLRS
jgi:hypothetical protein